MKKMNAKKTLVSFVAIATLLFLVATVSATEITGEVFGTIDDVSVDFASVIAGETIDVKVYFTADLLTMDATADGVDNDGDFVIDNPEESAYNEYDETASRVKIKVELEGEEGDSTDTTSYFDVENGKTYVKILTLEVPEVDEDFSSEDMDLTVKIWNSDFRTEVFSALRVQKPSYNADVMSIIVSSSVEAGQISPVDIVLRNTGYNDLEDLYVTVRIPELGLSRTSYFGDLVSVEDDNNYHHDDDEDTVSGRLYLEVPYDVASGIYTLEVEVINEDFSDIVERQIAVQNGFPEVAIKSGDNLLVLNPTNHLKVYKVVYPSAELTVVVQAGSSKVVPIEVSEGEYNFDVFVFAGNELAGTVNFSGTSEESEELASPVVILTVILAIIFLVLLVVMIVLITKKPEKTEEFGESYY